jgi:hypothetical protein
MVLLWQRHATAQGLVTRQDAFCFRCALQDLSDQIQKLKAEIGKQIDAKVESGKQKAEPFFDNDDLMARWKRWVASAETADATTSVAEVAS